MIFNGNIGYSENDVHFPRCAGKQLKPNESTFVLMACLVVAEWEEITTTLAAERSAAPGWRKFFVN
jgi:hypothetical protein